MSAKVIDLDEWRGTKLETLRIRLDSMRIEFTAEGGLELHLEGAEGEDITWDIAPDKARHIARTVLR